MSKIRMEKSNYVKVNKRTGKRKMRYNAYCYKCGKKVKTYDKILSTGSRMLMCETGDHPFWERDWQT